MTARAGEIVPARDELVAHAAGLRRPRGDDLRLRRHDRLRALRSRPRGADRVPRLAHLVRDLLVLVGDPAEVVDLVEDVLEARRREHDGEGVLAVGLVDVDEPVAEPLDGRRVLAPQEQEPLRLEVVERGQLREALLVQPQVLLQRVEPRRDVADPALQAPDADGDAGDLGAECALALLLAREPVVQ